jgi:hypothetical protein
MMSFEFRNNKRLVIMEAFTYLDMDEDMEELEEDP